MAIKARMLRISVHTAQYALPFVWEFLSIAVLMKWRISRADAKSAFLQTAEAHRDVFVIPRKESNESGNYLWLFLDAVYGLKNRSLSGNLSRMKSELRLYFVLYRFFLNYSTAKIIPAILVLSWP